MKLYYHPVSTTSRPVWLFIAENGIDCELRVVDLMKGEHYQPEYVAINPNRLVPVLEDGDFRLTESSAILKYLAEKTGSSTYPKELRARAKVNEMMDWINTQVCREFAYGLVYPQIFPTHKRRSDEAHAGTIAWGKEKAQGWLKVLNESSEELGQGARGLLRIRRLAQGQSLRGRLRRTGVRPRWQSAPATSAGGADTKVDSGFSSGPASRPGPPGRPLERARGPRKPAKPCDLERFPSTRRASSTLTRRASWEPDATSFASGPDCEGSIWKTSRP